VVVTVRLGALQRKRAIVPVGVDDLRMMFSSHCSFPFGHKWRLCKTGDDSKELKNVALK